MVPEVYQSVVWSECVLPEVYESYDCFMLCHHMIVHLTYSSRFVNGLWLGCTFPCWPYFHVYWIFG